MQLKTNYSAASGDMMAIAIGFAIVVHAAGIFGLSFSNENAGKPEMENIEVILVQQSSEEEPDEATFLAQANQEGGGESEESERPATPFVALNPEQSPEIVTPSSLPFEPMTTKTRAAKGQLKMEQPAEKEEEPVEEEVIKEKSSVKAEEVIAVEKPKAELPIAKTIPVEKSKSVESKEPEPVNAPKPKPESPSAEELVSMSLKMASLSAEIDKRLEKKAKRPRRDFITASTREYKYAAYMEAWRAKVERIGNINYPAEAKLNKLSGILRMTVALNADGTINEIMIDKSSGHQVLDEAAMHIVRLSAPFAVFPNNIRKDVDILHITRTWKFLNNSTFSGQ